MEAGAVRESGSSRLRTGAQARRKINAVGAARQAPVVEGGALAVGAVMTVTLSADHRVMDGALAARLLAAIVERVESPVPALA